MDTGAIESTRLALKVFLDAKLAIEQTFGVSGANGVVAEVLSKRRPRQGCLDNGCEYLVHGVGYTVTLRSGGLVHIDSGDSSEDVLSSYDIRLFMETEGWDVSFSLDDLREACIELSRMGVMQRVGANKFTVPAMP